jgi:hypothetical protein
VSIRNTYLPIVVIVALADQFLLSYIFLLPPIVRSEFVVVEAGKTSSLAWNISKGRRHAVVLEAIMKPNIPSINRSV